MLPRKIKKQVVRARKAEMDRRVAKVMGGVGVWRIGFRKSGKYDLPADEICGGG